MAKENITPISADEAISEEIAEYYSKSEASQSENTEAENTEQKTSPKPTPDKKKINLSHSESKLLFCSGCVLAASVILCMAFIIGTNHSADSTQTAITLDRLRSVSLDYKSAKAENKQLTQEVSELSQEALEADSKETMIGDYESTKQSLEKELNDAKAKLQSVNDELYNVNQEVKALKDGSKALELTPGTYSVGTNIPEGSFDVTGSGSIIAATSTKETVINSTLNPDTPVRLVFKSGYTVKINSNTKFAAAGASE